MIKLFVSAQTKLFSLREQKGATAVEYVLIVGGIAALIVGAIALFGNEIATRLGQIIPD